MTHNQRQCPRRSSGSSTSTLLAPDSSSPGAGLWLDCPLGETSGSPHNSPRPSPQHFPSPPPGPCCSGYATVFSSGHCGFILLHWWWVEDLTCSTFRLPCAKQQPLYCLHILLSVSVHLYILLDRLLEIPGNIFLPPVFLLEAACALPWCSLHISFWLFWDFSSPNRLPRTCFSVLGLSLLCVHFQLVKILLRSGIHLWLDLTQPLVH